MPYFCSKCFEENDRPEYSYCRSCQNAYMRAHRVRHSDLPDEQRLKANCRAYANVYQRRGKLVPEPCCICGTMENLEKHHADYAKPLEVIWYCRHHHIMHHGDEKAQGREALAEFARRKLADKSSISGDLKADFAYTASK